LCVRGSIPTSESDPAEQLLLLLVELLIAQQALITQSAQLGDLLNWVE
jgi:hypothetical protein